MHPDRRPKPSYVAAKTLLTTLRDFAFVERSPSGSDATYVLLFERCPQRVLAMWTTAAQPRDVRVIVDASAVTRVTLYGERAMLEQKGPALTVRALADPQYLIIDVPRR